MLGGGWEEVSELVLLGLRLDTDLIQLEAGRKMVIVLVKEFRVVGVKRKSDFLHNSRNRAAGLQLGRILLGKTLF